MAKLFISEYKYQAKEIAGAIPIAAPQTPALVVQTPVVIGAGSLQSAAFGAETRFIRVHTDAICSVTVGGTNPVATANSDRMGANTTEYFGVAPGDKIAVITNV